MMKQCMKRAILWAILPLCLAGCTGDKKEPAAVREEPPVYSNLLDEASREEVYGRLEAAGVPRDTMAVLDTLVEQYNRRMTVFDERDLAYMERKEDFFDYRDGFVEVTQGYVDYGSYYNYMKKWCTTGEDDDILCRILAYMLLQNEIHVEECLPEEQWACENEDAYLYSDREAFAENLYYAPSEDQRAEYFTLFDPIVWEDTLTEEKMAQAIQGQWAENGVRFSKSSLSLISIWTGHDGMIHNSHAAVLVDDEEGLLLVEKTNPFFPYQATKFTSREQLKQYMLRTLTAAFETDGLPVSPMTVLENDGMM